MSDPTKWAPIHLDRQRRRTGRLQSDHTCRVCIASAAFKWTPIGVMKIGVPFSVTNERTYASISIASHVGNCYWVNSVERRRDLVSATVLVFQRPSKSLILPQPDTLPRLRDVDCGLGNILETWACNCHINIALLAWLAWLTWIRGSLLSSNEENSAWPELCWPALMHGPCAFHINLANRR